MDNCAGNKSVAFPLVHVWSSEIRWRPGEIRRRSESHTWSSSRVTGVKKRTDQGDAAGVATNAVEAEATVDGFLSACDVLVVPD